MLIGYYEAPLVLLSILVAMLASYTALSLAERVSSAQGHAARWWIAGGAFAMGTGIWAMHFVGMLAFRLPIPLGYDLEITLLSWALPVAVSAVALWQLGTSAPSWKGLARSAVLLGVGIAAMHYVGMAAMRMTPAIEYDAGGVVASLAIAIAAAAAALWIGFRLRDSHSPAVWLYRAGASVVMGFAIVGMHYTGMAAASFPEGSICGAATGQFTLTQLATVVVIATVAILAIALLTTVYDARLEARTAVLALSEQTGRERQQMLDRERALRLEAERLSALKDEFLATLSHELRTPLNAVLGWAQVLRTRHDEAMVHKGVETIERNARLQARLIDDLLDMSRIVSGRVRLEPELIEPWAVVEAAVEAVRPAMFSKRIELSAELDRHCGRVWADPTRLQQVMWNLLSNASKFTPAQGWVTVTLRREQGQAVVRVADNGVGVAPDFLAHMFERFRQADATTTRRHGGLGLGLAITRQLIELHGGTVEVFSAGLGQGSCFTVRLPLVSAAAPAREPELPLQPGPAASPLQPPPHENLAGLQVLVVDDEPDARQLALQILGDRGARVLAVESAEAALELLRRQPFDVLVSDIGMPGMDGFELIRRVRAHPDTAVSGIRSVALTAFARAEDRTRALREGFDAYLPKPLEAAALVSQVARFAPVGQSSAS